MIEDYKRALPYIPETDIRNWVGPFQDKTYYHELGLSQARKVKDWLNITESSSLLDIGCGCGRLALHFTNEIGDSGSFCGFDCSPDLLAYCNEYIAPTNPAFSFVLLDTQNGAYNPNGLVKSQTVRFPFENNVFDSVVAWSVFTHMDFDSVANYIGETHRVMADNGLVCITMNFHDSNTLLRIAEGRSTLDISKAFGANSLTTNLQRPEDCFSHSREAIESVVHDYGFEILLSTEGWWSFGKAQGEYHDCIVCRKQPRF